MNTLISSRTRHAWFVVFFSPALFDVQVVLLRFKFLDMVNSLSDICNNTLISPSKQFNQNNVWQNRYDLEENISITKSQTNNYKTFWYQFTWQEHFICHKACTNCFGWDSTIILSNKNIQIIKLNNRRNHYNKQNARFKKDILMQLFH